MLQWYSSENQNFNNYRVPIRITWGGPSHGYNTSGVKNIKNNYEHGETDKQTNKQTKTDKQTHMDYPYTTLPKRGELTEVKYNGAINIIQVFVINISWLYIINNYLTVHMLLKWHYLLGP